MMSLTPGTRLGPYEVIGPIGAGGMGEVYKARDTRLARDVAVKVLPAARSGTHDAEARFEREARAIAAVNHPNICAIYDVGNHEGRSYLVMELLEGETLDQRLGRGPLDVAPLVDHAIALADALETAHGRGLMHRDLKPANIFLTKRGQLKVLDFGLAKAVDAGDDTTRTAGITASGTAVGTLGYMSPEQLLGDDVDPRADVFSLGAVLYEMATGRRAFQGSTVALITDAILHHTPPALHAVRPELPEKLCDVIASALEKNRDERCPSAGDLRANLMRVKRQLAPAAAPDVAPVRTSPSVTATPLASDSAAAVAVPARQLPLTLVAALVVALSVLGGAAWWLRAPSTPPATTPAVPAETAGAAAAPTNSIAVLAFADMSEKKDQEYFSDGLAEELLNQLAKMPDLQVTARTSSFSFKGKADDIRDIAKKLNVAHVLEGSVRKSGNQLRITAQLIRADTGVHLWSETYDREMKDVFTVQDEIATMVATALKAKIAPAQQASSARRTKNMDAYVQYLIGRQAYDEFTDASLGKAAAAYRQAIALDPGYGAAHAELAMSIFSQALPTNDTVRFDEALATAEKAVALAPEGATYGVRGYLRFVVALDWTGAIEDFDKALALNPGDSVLQRRYSTFTSGLGRNRESFAAAKKAFELDPLSQTALILYGLGLINNGRLTEAEELLTRTATVAGRLNYLSIAQRRQGRFADALATARLVPDEIGRLQLVAILEHSLGHERESQQALDGLIAAHGQTSPFTVATVHAWRGETDQAFQWLERARKARDTQLPRSLRATDTINSLRRDPRYAALEKAMKFPD